MAMGKVATLRLLPGKKRLLLAVQGETLGLLRCLYVDHRPERGLVGHPL